MRPQGNIFPRDASYVYSSKIIIFPYKDNSQKEDSASPKPNYLPSQASGFNLAVSLRSWN